MRQTYIPKALRDGVVAQARHRCGYCLTSEAVVGTPMEIDHIIPQSLGGPTEEDNLWLHIAAALRAGGPTWTGRAIWQRA